MVDPAVEDKIVAATDNRFEELPVEQKRKLNMDEEETQSGSEGATSLVVGNLCTLLTVLEKVNLFNLILVLDQIISFICCR